MTGVSTHIPHAAILVFLQFAIFPQYFPFVSPQSLLPAAWAKLGASFTLKVYTDVVVWFSFLAALALLAIAAHCSAAVRRALHYRLVSSHHAVRHALCGPVVESAVKNRPPKLIAECFNHHLLDIALNNTRVFREECECSISTTYCFLICPRSFSRCSTVGEWMLLLAVLALFAFWAVYFRCGGRR